MTSVRVMHDQELLDDAVHGGNGRWAATLGIGLLLALFASFALLQQRESPERKALDVVETYWAGVDEGDAAVVWSALADTATLVDAGVFELDDIVNLHVRTHATGGRIVDRICRAEPGGAGEPTVVVCDYSTSDYLTRAMGLAPSGPFTMTAEVGPTGIETIEETAPTTLPEGTHAVYTNYQNWLSENYEETFLFFDSSFVFDSSPGRSRELGALERMRMEEWFAHLDDRGCRAAASQRILIRTERELGC